MCWQDMHPSQGQGRIFLDHRPTFKVEQILEVVELDGGWRKFIVRLACGHTASRCVTKRWKHPAPKREKCNLCGGCPECREFFWVRLAEQRKLNGLE